MRVVILILVLSLGAGAQTFEVASVKVHPGGTGNINITTSGPRFRASAEMLAGLVMYAFDLKTYQFAFASPKLAWDDVYFDIEAKAEGNEAPKREDFRRMLQSLLAERFKLRFHHESRQISVYALTIGKSGSRLRESALDAVASLHGASHGRNQTMTLSKGTLEDIVGFLPLYTGRPVIDKTGLTGTYDVKFEATPAFLLNAHPDPADISVFVAVQNQLGLKLEAQRAMIDVLFIDHAEKPSGN